MNKILIAILLALAACGDSATTSPDAADDHCAGSTAYLGDEVDCMGGAGLCVVPPSEGAVGCFPKCAPTGSACLIGTWHTIPTATAEACWCE